MTDQPPAIDNRLFTKISESANWVMLAKLRNSFLSKATSALSLAAIGFTSLTAPLTHITDEHLPATIQFAGAAVFLLGYILTGIFTPPEIRANAELFTAVDQMTKIQDFDFFQSRTTMLQSLLARLHRSKLSLQMKAKTDQADRVLGQAMMATADNFAATAGALYYADLSLRQYDRRARRLACCTLLGLGVFLLFAAPLIAKLIKGAPDSTW